VNGKIAPKSNVIGVADPIAQRGRRNLWPRQRERPGVLPGFVPPACNQRGQREQGRSIRFKRKLVGPVKDWGSRSTRIYFEIALPRALRSTTLPTLASRPVCSVIAPDRHQNAITIKRAVSKRAISCKSTFGRDVTTSSVPSIPPIRSRDAAEQQRRRRSTMQVLACGRRSLRLPPICGWKILARKGSKLASRRRTTDNGRAGNSIARWWQQLESNPKHPEGSARWSTRW
jgi:hypothetical protein